MVQDVHNYSKKPASTSMREFFADYIDFTRHFIRLQDEYIACYRKQLLDACASGNSQVVASLLFQGWSTETSTKNGYTLLLIASSHGQTDVVKLLLSCGANVHAKQKNGRTSLEIAQARHYHSVQSLLEQYSIQEVTDSDSELPSSEIEFTE